MRNRPLLAVAALLFLIPSMADSQTFASDTLRLAEPTAEPLEGLVAGGDGLGRTVVAWTGSDGDGTGIHARRFDASGEPEGPSFLVHEETAGNQLQSGLAVAEDGSFAVIWAHREGLAQFDIRVRTFGADLTPDGPSRSLSSFVGDPQRHPAIAYLADGGLYAVWEYEANDVPISQIYGRLLDSQGAPRNQVIQISDAPGGEHTRPRLATGADGSVLFVWTNGEFGSNERILTRMRTPAGLLEEFARVVSPEAHIDISGVTVASARDGFLLAWSSRFTTPFGRFAYWRFLGLGDQELGDIQQVDPQPPGEPMELAAVRSLSGELMLAWTIILPPVPISAEPTSLLQARFFTSGVEPAGEIVTVDSEFIGLHDDLAVAGGRSKQFFVGWSEMEGPGNGRRLSGRLLQAPGSCVGDDQTLCLNGDRFQVRAAWRRPDGVQGPATARPLTDETGFFYFEEDGNIEMVVKVLDACSFSDHLWVFAAGLTNLEVELEVVDTLFDESRIYRNPLGQPFTPVQDTTAFATCP